MCITFHSKNVNNDDNDKIIKIMKIMKNNRLNENNKLIKYDLTTVNCTYNYTHSGKVSKYVISTTTMYVVPISAKSYAFCAALPMVSQVTPMLAYYLIRYRVCYLPPIRQTTNMEPLVDYPPQHIKHVHLQS